MCRWRETVIMDSPHQPQAEINASTIMAFTPYLLHLIIIIYYTLPYFTEQLKFCTFS